MLGQRLGHLDHVVEFDPVPVDPPLAVVAVLPAAGIQVLDQLEVTYPSVVKTWVDAGFKNQFVEHATTLGIDAEVVPRNTETRGFHVVKRRWAVERSLGRLMPHRRPARDYETLPSSSEAMIYIAMIDNVSRRITGESTPTWRGAY